jgi:hypothetical protein
MFFLCHSRASNSLSQKAHELGMREFTKTNTKKQRQVFKKILKRKRETKKDTKTII